MSTLEEMILEAEARGYVRGLAAGIRSDYSAGYRAGLQDGYGRGWQDAHYSPKTIKAIPDTNRKGSNQNVC